MKAKFFTCNYFNVHNIFMLFYIFSFLSFPFYTISSKQINKKKFDTVLSRNIKLQNKILFMAHKKNISSILSASYINNNPILARQINNSNLQTYVTDNKGSILKLNDLVDKTKNKFYSYDAYGLQINKDNNSKNSRTKLRSIFTTADIENYFQYNGERFDSNTQLQYLRARFYSSIIKRFINQDSFSLLNRFNYVNANPINNTDPSGHVTLQELPNDAFKNIISYLNQNQISQLASVSKRLHEARKYYYESTPASIKDLALLNEREEDFMDRYAILRVRATLKIITPPVLRDLDGRILPYNKQSRIENFIISKFNSGFICKSTNISPPSENVIMEYCVKMNRDCTQNILTARRFQGIDKNGCVFTDYHPAFRDHQDSAIITLFFSGKLSNLLKGEINVDKHTRGMTLYWYHDRNVINLSLSTPLPPKKEIRNIVNNAIQTSAEYGRLGRDTYEIY